MTEYQLGDYAFDLDAFLPDYIFERITEIRVDAPEIILQHAQARRRRDRIGGEAGRISILAADHPGRGVTVIGDDPFAMGDRKQYIGRILRILTGSDFDGFMSTHDMIDELLIVDYLVQQGGGPSFLDGKVLIGCMQRGGVVGVVGEIDDRFGCYSADSIARFNLDGGKMLLRAVDSDERTLNTVDYCSQAVTDLNRVGLTPFVEPLYTIRRDGRYQLANTADALVKWVGVCAALGDASHRTWLKLPYVPDFHRVTMATTMPILMLGGPSKGDPRDTYGDFVSAMATRSNVRGAMVGRNVTYPGREDPAAVARAIHAIVHDGIDADAAVALTQASRDDGIDWLRRYISA